VANVEQTVKKIIANTVQIDESYVTNDAQMSDLGVESIHMVEIGQRLMEELKIPENSLGIVQPDTVQDVIDLVKKKVPAA
jgi:acyl carrier protein